MDFLEEFTTKREAPAGGFSRRTRSIWVGREQPANKIAESRKQTTFVLMNFYIKRKETTP